MYTKSIPRKLSAHPLSSNYDAEAVAKIRISFENKELKDVVFYDLNKGYYIQYSRDNNGDLIKIGDSFSTVRREGVLQVGWK